MKAMLNDNFWLIVAIVIMLVLGGLCLYAASFPL